MRALIVIDVQNVYETGPLPIAYPPLSTSLANIAIAMDRAVDEGMPIIIVQNTPPGTTPEQAKATIWDLHPAIADRQRDHLVVKHLPSAFAGTDLDESLHARDVDTLTLVGYMTHNCVDSTAREALHLGYTVEILNDATGTLPYANAAGSVDAVTLHTTTLIALHARFAAVVSTEDWVAALRSGTPPRRGDVMDSARQGAALTHRAQDC